MLKFFIKKLTKTRQKIKKPEVVSGFFSGVFHNFNHYIKKMYYKTQVYHQAITLSLFYLTDPKWPSIGLS